MPSQTQTSGLFKKFGARLNKAAAGAMEKPVTYGNARLPGGITNGVAKLTGVVLGQIKADAKKNAGDPYIRFTGVIDSPKSVDVDGNEVPVYGLQTSIMHTLGDTETQGGKKTSFEEHVEDACNEMRKLAGEDFDTSDFEAAVANLNQAAQDQDIYFRFSTSWKKDQQTGKINKDDQPWENWFGTKGLEDYSPEDAQASQTQDDTTPPPTRTPPARTAPSANGKPATAPANRVINKVVPGPDPNPDGAAGEVDVQALLEKANAGDSFDFQEYAIGILGKEPVEQAPDWDTVAKMLEEAAGGGGESDAPAADKANPKAGDVFFYKPPKAKKALECEVKTVNTKGKTCTLLNLTDGKTMYKDVKFSDLEEGQ